MAPLAGLTGLDQPSQVTDQGVLEAHGGPVDTSHGEYGGYDVMYPAAYGSGYHGTTYAGEIPQDSEPPGMSSGMLLDDTPSAHRAPWPRGIPQVDSTPGSYTELAEVRFAQDAVLHGTGHGGPGFLNRQAPAGRETPVDYTVDRYDAPNETLLSQVPGQLRGFPGKDTSQGYGQLNPTDEFARGHSIRIVQHDRMPWDYSLRESPPQPFWGRKEQVQARFDGPGSPYGVYGDTSTGQQVMARTGGAQYPTSVTPPAEPVTLPQASGVQDVWPGW